MVTTEQEVNQHAIRAIKLVLARFDPSEAVLEFRGEDQWLYWRDSHKIRHGGLDAPFAAIHEALDRGFHAEVRSALQYLRSHLVEVEHLLSYRYARLYCGVGDNDEAHTLLQTALRVERHPYRRGMIRYDTGLVLLELDRPGEAVAQFEKAEKLLKYPEYIHKPLGIAYSRAGRFREAQDRLGWAITFHPDDPAAYHERAAAALALGDRQAVWICEYHLRRLNAKEADDVMRMRLVLAGPSQGA